MTVQSQASTLAAPLRAAPALDPVAQQSVDAYIHASDQMVAVLGVALPLIFAAAALVMALWFLGILPVAVVPFR